MFNKFKQKICWILCRQFCFISVATTAPGVVLPQQQAADVHYYKHVAISSVDEDDNRHDSFKTKADRKLIIQSLMLKSSLTANANERMTTSKITELKKPTWAITVEQLPISEHQCNVVESDTCDDK